MHFILGGAGFVGSAYARALARAGRPHVVLTRDNYADYVGQRCDVFINANGNSKKFLAQRAPLEDFDASVRSVRQSLVDFRCGTYVFLSSCDVYPDCSTPATTREDQPLNVAAQSPYGFHKYLAEQCVQHAAPRWLVFRQGGFVGPGLWKNAIHDILQGGPLWLDPASELQFLHTDAAAALVLELIDRGLEGQVVNLCGQGTVALAEVCALVGRHVEVKPGSPCARYEVNVERLARLIDVPPTRPAVLQFVQEMRAELTPAGSCS